MIANAERWEGQVVAGKFRLGRRLGGSECSAVFLVEGSKGEPQKVIRFVEAGGSDGRHQLSRWETASKLSHPNLIRIFETGRCKIEGADVFYLVTEYAEENLGQILPERRLSGDETRQVLKDVLAALAYVHGQGLVHGSLKPSNILAIGETVKVSSDRLRTVGNRPEASSRSAYDAPEFLVEPLAPSADIWSLGVALVEALTQQRLAIDWPREQPALPSGVPAPFQEIVENCLQVDPAKRWTVAQIQAHLGGEKAETFRAAPASPDARSSSPVAPVRKESAKWPYAIAAVAAVVLAVVLFGRHKTPTPESTPQKASESAPAASPTQAPAPSRPGEVALRAIPDISPSAMHTISGKIRLAVDIDVDEKGNVTEARMRSSGPSQFFARKVLDATKRWKFRPPLDEGEPVASRWRLRFTLTHRAIDDAAEQIKP